MKNKMVLMVSLILIAFLIGTSYAPMAAPQAVMAQESDPYEAMMDLPESMPKGRMVTGTKEELQQELNFAGRGTFNLPGAAFQRSWDKPSDDQGHFSRSFANMGRAIYTNADLEKSVELIHPVIIPEFSLITAFQLCGQIKYTVDPQKSIKAILLETNYYTNETHHLATVILNEDSVGYTGCVAFYPDEPFYFSPYTENYYIIVSLPASAYGKNTYHLVSTTIQYTPPSLFPMALPMIQTKP